MATTVSAMTGSGSCGQDKRAGLELGLLASQREVSVDELACEPSPQVLAGLRPCPWWMGYCRSEVAALRVPCPTKACIFMTAHLT